MARIEVLSWRPTYCENPYVFGALAFAHVKNEKLKVQVERCIFTGNIRGVKWYKLWRMEPREARYYVSREITFDEALMAMICRDLNKGKEKFHLCWSLLMMEKLVWRSQTMYTNLLPFIREGLNVQKLSVTISLCLIGRKRTVKPIHMFGYADLVTIVEEIEGSMPRSIQEAIKGVEGQ